jgi:hypothetical protein
MLNNSGSLPPTNKRQTWWNIHEDALLAMLRRVAAGEDPDMVYAETYAAASMKIIGGEDAGE